MTDKRDAVIAFTTGIVESLEAGGDRTDTVDESLPALAAMVHPYDADLARRVLACIR